MGIRYSNRLVGLSVDVGDAHGVIPAILDAVSSEYEAAAQYFVLMNALSGLGRPDLAKVVMHIFTEELEHAGELSAIADEIMGAVVRKKFVVGYDDAKKMMSGYKPKD